MRMNVGQAQDLSSQHGLKLNIQVYTCLIHACFQNRCASLASHFISVRGVGPPWGAATYAIRVNRLSFKCSFRSGPGISASFAVFFQPFWLVRLLVGWRHDQSICSNVHFRGSHPPHRCSV